LDHNFFPEGRPHFLRQIVIAIYCPPFGKSSAEFRLLMSVCEAGSGNEVECRIYVGG